MVSMLILTLTYLQNFARVSEEEETMNSFVKQIYGIQNVFPV